MPTTYRVVLETETRPREAAVALDHLPAIQVDAPDVDVAARLAVSHHIDGRPTPPPAGTSFGLVVITPPPYDPKVPPPRPRRRGRDAPDQRRVLAHRDRRALTAADANSLVTKRTTSTAAWAAFHDRSSRFHRSTIEIPAPEMYSHPEVAVSRSTP